MIPVLRQQQILEFIKEKGSVSLSEGVKGIGISESTIRRDLKELEQQGFVDLYRGGGICVKGGEIELELDEKMVLHKEEKDRIARYAASLVYPHDVIFLDPSSANHLMIDYLPTDNITVVTNSIAHINKLVKRQITCLLIGGEIKRTTSSCIGPIAEDTIANLRFSKCFLGANGMSVKYGLTNHDVRERIIKRVAIASSVATYFLVDASKYGTIAKCKVADIDEYAIITDRAITEMEGMENIFVASE